MIKLLPQSLKETADFPLAVREDLADALARLARGAR